MNGNGHASGSFDVKFKAEKNFKVFGREYAKCYSNFQSKGQLSKPVPNGPLSYKIDFHLDCGCDTVLGEFKRAYDTTFENKITFPKNAFSDFVTRTERLTEIQDKDFTATLISCGNPHAYNSLKPHDSLDNAKAFFEFERFLNTYDDSTNYIDKDGLVQFIIATELADNPDVQKKVVELKDLLVALLSIVTAYINQKADLNNNPAIKKDPVEWQIAMSHLPLMSASKLEEQTYSRHLKGVEIAVDFLNFIMDAVTGDAGQALASFKDYLGKQGEAIRFGTDNNNDSYNVVSTSVVVEVMDIGSEIVYLPKLRMHQAHFDRENYKFTTMCGSYEEVKINLGYQVATSLFDYQALQDPEVKKEFDDFINGGRKAQIENADTFFNGSFPVSDQSA